ncbi:MAG: substrate-binding domain-containing protein [Candidatus Kaistia colombiensis]|nr:MAG: substrate-binding domain-containing protein [Kaistia sp.]
MKRTAAALAALSAIALTSALVPQAKAEEKKPYKIYLSNNFVGNDWRQQMLRIADTAVKKAPLAGRVDLKVENVETTTQAQINSLNNIIRTKPDAILIDVGSPTALNPTIEKACAAGILVITFDQVATADCAYKVESDWSMLPAVQAEWIAEKIGGKGKVFVDRGLAGAPISEQLQSGFEKVLKNYPGIEIVGYFNGNYALGPEQEGVASLLAAHPQVDAILTQGYGSGAIKALQDAGRPLVPGRRRRLQHRLARLRPDGRRPVHPRDQPGLSLGRGPEARGRHPRRQGGQGEARLRLRAVPRPPIRSPRSSIPT